MRADFEMLDFGVVSAATSFATVSRNLSGSSQFPWQPKQHKLKANIGTVLPMQESRK
jgi:hypothetical protein